MKAELILKNYEIAKERYAALGVDTDKAIETLEKTPISLHCWQADDVVGFERGEAASGGIQSTGNYPGKARNIDELRQDIEKVTLSWLVLSVSTFMRFTVSSVASRLTVTR